MKYYDDYRVEPVDIELIDWATRARKKYENIDVLARKIEQEGLLNPITLYEKQDGDNAQPFLLLAGGRRTKAHQYLKYDKIMAHIYDKPLSELQIKSIELMENVDREDYSYDDKIQLEKEIHELMVKIHGSKVSTAPDAPGHSLSDTAKLLKRTPAKLSQDMKIAKAMEDFPELQWDKMKNRAEALKVVDKVYNSINRMECAAKAEREMGTGDLRKKKLYDSFMVGDFFKHSENLPDNYFDICEVDPPYAINLKKSKKGYSYEGYNEIKFEEYSDFITKVIRTCYKKMAEHSWLVLWFAPDPWFDFIGHTLKESGFDTLGMVGLWVKGEETEDKIVESASGQAHMPNSRLANAYEMFYYAWKGNPCLAKPGSSNVFGYKPVPPGKKTHPTERPLALIDDLLCTFAIEGSRILVPFAGSGTTLISAARNKMVAIGYDLTQAYKDSYILRVNEMF